MAPVIQELLDAATVRLQPFTDTPQLDAQVLLSHILEKPRTWLLAHSASVLDGVPAATFESMVQQLEHGEALPYLLGHWEFFGLDFDLTPDVLIPRPETELLVERGITWLQASPSRRRLADLGTGSGCIGIALANNIANLHIMATDISLAALNVARRNALKLGVTHQIDFVECDILPKHNGVYSNDYKFDMICANLPYIPTNTLRSLPVNEREPLLALDGGSDGLDPFRKLFKLVPEWIASGGHILLEVEATQGASVLSLAYDAFNEAELHLRKDLTGRDRLLEIQLPLD